MASQEQVVRGAIDRSLARAESAGCAPDGHYALCESVRMIADELHQGFGDTQEQIALVSGTLKSMPGAILSQLREAGLGSDTGGRMAWLGSVVMGVPTAWGRVIAASLVLGAPVTVVCLAILLALWGAGFLSFGHVADTAKLLVGKS